MKDKFENLIINLTAQWARLDTSKKRLVQILGLVLFVIILNNTFVPLIKKYRELSSSINDSEEKLHLMRTELSSLGQVKETGKHYAEKLDSLSVALSDKLDLSVLLPLARHNVNILEFEPKKTLQSEGFTRILIDLQVIGGYKEIVHYINFIEDANIVSTIDSFTIAPFAQNPKQTLAKIALSVFSGPKADTTLIFPSFGAKKNESFKKQVYKKPELAGFISFSKTEDTNKKKTFTRSKTKFTISGVWLGKVAKLAINGKVIRENDMIQGWRLVKIDRKNRKAILVKNGVHQVIKF